jgi:serine/threonine protein kinase
LALAPGTRLGAYEILTLIGSGGMGEVYKARDTRLDRIIAIKILPATLAADSQFRERFDREARAISHLTHSNICTLHDVGEQAGTPFLVMEYLEGETLETRLRKGVMPINEALKLAMEIADALRTAHRAGIVHRDLKPGNVMLTKGGAKLLDFGLAKATAPVAASSLSILPTTPPGALTAQGSLLGTFQYMAPEQIEGQEADARTDIFAFGVVCHEMLTGTRAFSGRTQASLFGAILRDQLPPVSTIQPSTPPVLDHLVQRCLAKDPDDRWQTAADVMHELKWIAERGAQTVATGAPPAHTPTMVPRRREQVAWTLVATAVMILLALSIATLRSLRERPDNADLMRFEIPTPHTAQPLHFALSPDGSRLVFVASGDGPSRLWLRPLDSVSAQPLAGTEGGEYPFWSPDSRSIGFFAAAKLKRLDIAGGVPQILADAASGRGAAWAADGTILFAPSNASPLWRVPASGGQATVVTKVPRGSHRLPQFLPDGRHYLFFAQDPDSQGIYLGSLDGGDPKRLVSAVAAGAYAEPGFLVFLQQSALVARRLNLATGTLEGDPVTVADGIDYDASFNVGGFSVAKARLVYRLGGQERRQLTWFDRTGKPLGTIGDSDASGLLGPALSPDGRRVAVMRNLESNTDLWLIDLLRGGTTRFTFDPANDQMPVWSPDGGLIAFMSNRKGIYDLYVKPSSGGGTDSLILASSSVKAPTDWSRDGRFLLFQYADPQTGWDLGALPMTGERKPIPLVKTPFEERTGQFSPDGRWIAYQSNESGRFEIYVQPFPGPGGKWPVSTAGGTDPRWRADGGELFFVAPDATLMAVRVHASGATFDAEAPTALFHTRMVAGGLANLFEQYTVSRDGRFLVNVPADGTTTVAPITCVINWHPLKP